MKHEVELKIIVDANSQEEAVLKAVSARPDEYQVKVRPVETGQVILD